MAHRVRLGRGARKSGDARHLQQDEVGWGEDYGQGSPSPSLDVSTGDSLPHSQNDLLLCSILRRYLDVLHLIGEEK